MSNIAINERRARKLRWQMKEGKLVATTFIDKKILETFYVTFELNPKDGKTDTQIRNLVHPELNQEKVGYDDLNVAIHGVNEFFEKMDELTSKIPSVVKMRAYDAYRNEITRAIKLVKEGGEVQ